MISRLIAAWIERIVLLKEALVAQETETISVNLTYEDLHNLHLMISDYKASRELLKEYAEREMEEQNGEVN